MCGVRILNHLGYSLCLLLFWIFPIPLSCFACWSGSEKPRCCKVSGTSSDWGRRGKWKPLKMVVLLSTIRYGEALHPGPEQSPSWSLGVFNPSGLTSKTSALATVQGDIWLGSETHLTANGVRSLVRGMKALGSEYAYVVPGAPCPNRKSRQQGSFAGVLSISKYPARALPHNFPSGVFESSRLQVCGFAIGPLWVQAGLMYGLPDSVQYQNRTFQTEVLLDALVDRIGLQADGVRIIGGDFNHSPDQLASIARLRQLGFCEAQEVASFRWGHQIRPTARGPFVIDQLWLSPEAQSLLCGLSLHEDHWSDHLAVEAHFQSELLPLQSFAWNMPSKFPWPEDFDWSPVVDWSNPSMAYGSFWYQAEQAADCCVQRQGGSVLGGAFGRGQTLESIPKFAFRAPSKIGRVGTEQPLYFGASLLHGRWFKQLRRLQALSRMLQADSCNPNHRIKICELWKVIRNAPGFGQGFCKWWAEQHPTRIRLCVWPPTHEEANMLFESFRIEFRHLERQLQAARYQHAKETRKSQPNLIFKDCARDAPEVLDILVHDVTVDVEQVNIDDCSVVFTHPVCLQRDHPVVIQGVPRTIIHAEADQAWLESIDNIEVGAVARQLVSCTSDADIISAFRAVWQPRWNKVSHVCESQWEQIVGFCNQTFAPIKWQHDDITPTRLHNAIAKKKHRSAIGPDGVSRSDLLALPLQGMHSLCDLFTFVENGGQWPVQVVQGFVNSLSKGRGQWVDSYRPIVVYPIILRACSSIRAKEALCSLQPHLPSSVKGGIPGGQAKAIWFQIAQLLESANMNASSLQGVVVDIQRAFNAFPRWPILSFLACMGYPIPVVRAWSAFLFQQQRRFRVRTSVSAGVDSCTGYPEGCAMSVFAMACVDYMLDAWLTAMEPPIRNLFTYVDDWHVLTDQPETLIRVWDKLGAFANALDLTIDAAKSFLWAALPEDRVRLQEAPLKLSLASKSLGAHHNFCRKKGNKTVVARIDALVPLWPRLRASASPFRTKVRALFQVAWPRALYGVSVVCLGAGHYQRLRTGALRGLKADRVGANPIAHLASASIWADPEVWATLQTFREVRELACEEAMQAMLQWLVSGVDIPSNGPTSILVDRCKRLGWHLNPQGRFCDDIGDFSIFHLSWDALVLRVKIAWPRVLASELVHRRSFAGIHRAWIDEAARCLKKLSPQDQVYVRCAMDGTLYHETTKTKAERGKHTVCVHCGHFDSVYHRLWECPFFEECRQQFPWKSLLPSIPQAMSCHAWPLLPEVWFEMQQFLDDLPPCAPNIEWPPHSPGHVFDVFTDGTCAFPKDSALRFSSWSISLAAPSATMLEHQVLATGHTAGTLQSSFRAELEAIVVLIEAATRSNISMRIWCDCLAVVKGTRRLLLGGLVKQNRSHADLWIRIAHCVQHLQENQIRIVKVVSHAPCSNATDSVEEWAFWHNRMADEAAHERNMDRSPEFWQLWHRLQHSIVSGRRLHADILRVILSVARFDKCQQKEACHGDSGQRSEAPAEDQREIGSARRVRWSFTTKLAVKYRYNNIAKLHCWWSSVGVPALSSREPLQWLSGVQLYLDFYFSTLYNGMVSLEHSSWFDEDDLPANLAVGIGKRATMFLRVWNAYCRVNGLEVPHRMTRPASGSLWFWSMCWRLPWPKQRLHWIDSALMVRFGCQIMSQKSLQTAEIAVPAEWPRC